MRFAIDVVFVGWPPSARGSLAVVYVHERVSAFRIVTCAGRARALAAVELEAGRAATNSLVPGVTLVLV